MPDDPPAAVMNGAASRGPLRVALVVNSLILGGAQNHIIKLCQHAMRHDLALSVFLLLRDEVKTIPPDMPAEVSVHVAPFRRHDPRVLLWLVAELRAMRFCVAHSFLWYADAVCSLASLLFARGIPLICSERGERAPGLYGPAQRIYDRLLTFRVARALCTNSEFGRRLLVHAGAPQSKVRVIPNGVDTSRIDALQAADLRGLLGWPSTCTVVGAVCRLVWYKGVDTFLRALSSAAKRVDVRGVVIGDGPMRPRLEIMARDLGLEERVAFLGVRNMVEAYVKAFDIAVLATRTDSELCSNSILEYMACARPVIATRVGGNSELVVAGETGILVERDDASELGQAIEELASARDRARVMGLAGRRRVEREFRIEAVSARFVELWRQSALAAHAT